jgi:hypothetical protein
MKFGAPGPLSRRWVALAKTPNERAQPGRRLKGRKDCRQLHSRPLMIACSSELARVMTS